MTRKVFDDKKVKLVAKLSGLKFSKSEISEFKTQFNETLQVVEKLSKIDTTKVKITFQVTGLTNVFRRDIVEKERIFSQKEALSNSKNIHEGYFVVKGVLSGE